MYGKDVMERTSGTRCRGWHALALRRWHLPSQRSLQPPHLGLLHLTICSPESDGSSESHLNAEKQPDVASPEFHRAQLSFYVLLGFEHCHSCDGRSVVSLGPDTNTRGVF